MATVVTSKIKQLVKKQQLNTAGDFVPALEKELSRVVERACTRCRANGRKTVRGADL